MTDFERLKSSYITLIQLALAANIDAGEIKNGNNILSHFCKNWIKKIAHDEYEQQRMEQEIDDIKEMLSYEIDMSNHSS